MRKALFIFLSAYSNIASPQINCSNWLNTPSIPSFVDIGNLNATGAQITVEAFNNRTVPYAEGLGDGNEGDIVLKHDNPTDVGNGILRGTASINNRNPNCNSNIDYCN